MEMTSSTATIDASVRAVAFTGAGSVIRTVPCCSASPLVLGAEGLIGSDTCGGAVGADILLVTSPHPVKPHKHPHGTRMCALQDGAPSSSRGSKAQLTKGLSPAAVASLTATPVCLGDVRPSASPSHATINSGASYEHAAAFFGLCGDVKAQGYSPLFAPLSTCSVHGLYGNVVGGAASCGGLIPVLALVSSGDLYHVDAHVRGGGAAEGTDAPHRLVAFSSLTPVTEHIRTALAACNGPEWFSCWGNALTIRYEDGMVVIVMESEGAREQWLVVGDLRTVAPSAIGAWSAARLHGIRSQYPQSTAPIVANALPHADMTASTIGIGIDAAAGIVTTARVSLGHALLAPIGTTAESAVGGGGDAMPPRRPAFAQALPLRAALSTMSPIPSNAQQPDDTSTVTVTLDVNVFVVSGTAAAAGKTIPLQRRHVAWQSGPFSARSVVSTDAMVVSLHASRGVAFGLRECRGAAAALPSTIVVQALLPSMEDLYASMVARVPSLHTVLAASPVGAAANRPLIYLSHYATTVGGGSLAPVVAVDADFGIVWVDAFDCVSRRVAVPSSAYVPAEEGLLSPRAVPPAMRVVALGTSRGRARLAMVKGGGLVVLEWDMPRPAAQPSPHMALAHAAIAKALAPHGGAHGDGDALLHASMASFMSAIPLFRRVIGCFVRRSEGERVSPSMVADACAAWEQRGRLCDESYSSHMGGMGLIPPPAFYFQFLLGSLVAIRHADQLVAVVRGLAPMVAHWAGASAVDAEAMWPLVRAVRRWQSERIDSPSLAPHLDYLFISLFRHYYDNDAVPEDVCAAAEEEIAASYGGMPGDGFGAILGAPRVARDAAAARPQPLYTYSGDPNEALLSFMSRHGGEVPFAELITGASKDNDRDAVAPHRPLLRTEQRADGMWVVEALGGNIDVLHGVGMLLAASLCAIPCALYLTHPSPNCGFAVASVGSNPTEACVIVEPTPLGDGDEGHAETLQVLACDVLTSCCATRHVHQALPAAVLCALASRRYHALGPILELHQHSTIAKYNDTLLAMVHNRGSGRLGVDVLSIGEGAKRAAGSKYMPRPFADILASLRAPMASATAVTAEELLVMCQYAASCDPSTLMETLLALVPTPALSLAATVVSSAPSGTAVNSTAGAVAYAMVMCHGLAAAAEESFEEELVTPSNHLAYGLDRLKRYFSEGAVVGPISPTVARIMSTVVAHCYAEHALAAMNNYTAAVQQRHLAKDEASQQAAQHAVARQSRRAQTALHRATTLMGFLANVLLPTNVPASSSATSPADYAAAYHADVYLPTMHRVVMAAVRGAEGVETSVAAAAGHLSLIPRVDCDVLTDTCLLDYHVLWSAQQALEGVASVKQDLAALAKGVAAALRGNASAGMGPSPASAMDAHVHAALGALELLLSAAMQPMLPSEECYTMLLTAARLFVARAAAAGDSGGAHAKTGLVLGAALILEEVLALADVERNATNVTILREYHRLLGEVSSLAGSGQDAEEAAPAEAAVAMVLIPGQQGSGAVAGPSPRGSKPPAQLVAEARVASTQWSARLAHIKMVYGHGTRHGPSIVAAVLGGSAVPTDLRCSMAETVGGAMPWRCDHDQEARRFLIATGWWQQVPMPVAMWALTHQVLAHTSGGGRGFPTADDLIPEPISLPGTFGLAPGRSSGKQSPILDMPLFALVCAMVPPSRGFARVDDPTAVVAAYHHNPLTAVTPEPLRRSLIGGAGAVGVRESALSMPSVCVSASTPSHAPNSPNHHRHRGLVAGGGADDVVRMSMGDDSILLATPTKQLEGPGSGAPQGPVESAVFTVESIAWWEDGPPAKAPLLEIADVTGTTATTTTITDTTASITAPPDAHELTKRLLLEVLAARDDADDDGAHRHRRRHHRSRRHHSRKRDDSAPPVETFRPVAAATASGLMPPGQRGPPATGSGEVPLIALPQKFAASRVRLFTTNEDGSAVPMDVPALGVPVGGGGPFMPAPCPMPPFNLGVPPQPPHQHFGGGVPMPGAPAGSWLPPAPQQANTFFMASYQQQQQAYCSAGLGGGAGMGDGEGTVYLKMPPPPAGYKAKGAPAPPGAVEVGNGEIGGAAALEASLHSDGKVILGMEEALRAEERLKRKASRRLAKASKEGSSDDKEGSGRKGDKKEKAKRKDAASSPLLPDAGLGAAVSPSPAVAPAVQPTVGTITNLPAAEYPLGPTEQVQFRKYVDDLLARNPSATPSAPINIPDLPPGFSVVGSPAPSSPKRTAPLVDKEGESMLHQLLARQQAMFELHQDVMTRNQQENTKLLRDLIVDKQHQSSIASPGLASAMHTLHASMGQQTSMSFQPIATAAQASALGLTATQQGQLLNQTMDQRDRLLKMNDDILRLQAQNAALAMRDVHSAQPQYVNNGPQVVYVPMGATAPVPLPPAAAEVVPPPAAWKPVTVDSAAQSSPMRVESAAVNTSQPHALHAGVQAYITPDASVVAPMMVAPPQAIAAAPSLAPPLPVTVDNMHDTLAQMDAVTAQLSSAALTSEGMARVMDEARVALGRCRELCQFESSSAEQSAAINALNIKAGILQGQLTRAGRAPHDASPVGVPVRSYSTDWDRGAANATVNTLGSNSIHQPPQASLINPDVSGAILPTVSPLRQSMLGGFDASGGGAGFSAGAPPMAMALGTPLGAHKAASPLALASASNNSNGSRVHHPPANVSLTHRYPDANTPHKSIIKEASLAASNNGNGGGALLNASLSRGPHPSALPAVSGSSPSRVSFAAGPPSDAVRKSVTIGDVATTASLASPRPATFDGCWEVLGGAVAGRHCQHDEAPRPSTKSGGASSVIAAPTAPIPSVPAPYAAPAPLAVRPTNIMSMGEVIAEAKAKARREQKRTVVSPSSSTKRPATAGAGGQRSSSATRAHAVDARFAMYLAPQPRTLGGRTRTPPAGPSVTVPTSTATGAGLSVVPYPSGEDCFATAGGAVARTSGATDGPANPWELRDHKRFEYGDAIATRQRGLLMDHTAQRIKGLQGLLH